MKARDLLTADEVKLVTGAIREAEKDTSGEIRVHLDEKCPSAPMERAEAVFNYLGMDKTKLRNGVLIYVACQSKVFAIIGDKGINDAVPENFWKDVTDVMKGFFSASRYAEGLTAAIRMTGEKLKTFFPYRSDDVNELPDEISYGQTKSE